MNICILIILTAMEIVLFTLLGLTLTPKKFLDCEEKEKTTLFMFAPILGLGIHTAIISILSLTVGYNFWTCLIPIVLEAGAIIIGYKKLWIDKDWRVILYMVAAIIGAALMEYGIMPKMIDGGLYFPPSVYDHARIAIVDSIVSNGFPVLSPWATNKGEMVQMGYHFGMHIVSAQISTVFGADTFLSATSLTGTIFYAAALCIGAMSLSIGKSKRTLLFVIPVIFMANIQYGLLEDIANKLTVLPDAFGFWEFFDNTIWGPHHTLAGAIVFYICWLLTKLLNPSKHENKEIVNRIEKEVKSDRILKIEISVLIALLAAAASVCSIYAGALALVFVGGSALIYVLFNKEYRDLVKKNLPWIGITLVLSAIACTPFSLCLLKHATGNSYLEFGIMPSLLHTDGFFKATLSLFTVLLVLLPIRVGFQYILGVIAFFGVKFDKQKWENGLYKTIIVVSVLVPLFVHSSIYSNDFAWRSGYPAYAFLMCLGAVLLDSLYEKITAREIIVAQEEITSQKKHGGYWKCVRIAYIFVIVLIVLAGIPKMLVQISPTNTQNPEMHVEFAGVVKGWEAIQNHTDKNDIVLCNPTVYGEINPSMGDEIPNYAFSYYSGRYSPLGDISLAKTISFSVGEENIYALNEKIQDFFSGNPSKEAVDYFYDTEKVKAILVTPQDGLYTSEGSIREKYPNMIEGEYYKVYLAE